jgi:hypothetical protein
MIYSLQDDRDTHDTPRQHGNLKTQRSVHMKKNILIFTLTLAAFHFASAQSAQSVYFELGGPGLTSLNYDIRFKGQDGLGARIGFGAMGSDNEAIVYLPLGLNYLIGKDGPHYFEIGGGVTPVLGEVEGDDVFQNDLFGHLLLGYRFQPINKGFSLRAFMCPVFGNGEFVPYYAGLSIGYKF